LQYNFPVLLICVANFIVIFITTLHMGNRLM